jgi:polyisoprenoid-binding protein YceI
MVDGQWQMDGSEGTLLVTTGVAGPASAVGHRLTLVMTTWRGEVQFTGSEPSSVEVTVDVDSLEVRRGSGGVKGLSGPEKALARSNALKSLQVDRHPEIRFRTDDISVTDTGYRLAGTLEIHGRSRSHVVDLRVADGGTAWQLSCESTVRQTDFGVKPYSLMMGALKVADEVTVSFTAEHPKD